MTIDVLSDVKSKSRDLQSQIQIPQAALDKAALWLTKQQGVTPGAISESGNTNNKIFDVRWCYVSSENLCVHKILASKAYISSIAWQHFHKFLSVETCSVLTENYVAFADNVLGEDLWEENADYSLTMCFIIDFFRAKHL